MCSSNPSQTKNVEAKARDAAIQISCNSQPITTETLDGVTYYTTTRRGVDYTAYILCGQWFVATHRKALGRLHVGGGRYYKSFDDLATGCKAFAALPVFLSLLSALRNRPMNTNANTASLFEIFGEPIYTYAREQAFEDGVLIDLSYAESDTAPVCRQHYKVPIACTAAVFEIMQKAVENPRYCQDYAGILHDMLWMSKAMARRLDESTVIFRCIVVGAGRSKYHDFKLMVHGGDQGEPVITISLPHED